MRLSKMAFFIAALMLAASIGAVVGRPSQEAVNPEPMMTLETTIPAQFGNWELEPRRSVQIINPQLQTTLEKIYSQILERTYVNADGYRIMLSVVYGPDQRGSMKAHDPEGCYVAQGFSLLKQRETSQLTTPFGTIPVGRLFMSKGPRLEPVSYWIMIGDYVPKKWQSTLVRLSYTLTGRVPDGLIFRVSSIDRDQARAIQLHDQFVNELFMSVSPAERSRLTGLVDSSTE